MNNVCNLRASQTMLLWIRLKEVLENNGVRVAYGGERWSKL